MKFKGKSIFQYILLLIPLIVLFLYKNMDRWDTLDVWYYLILYTGLISGVYALFKIKDNGIKNKFSKIEIITIIFIILFFTACIISTILSKSPIQSLLGTDYRKEGLFTYICYAGIMFNSMFILNKDKKRIYQLFNIVGVILSIFTYFSSRNSKDPRLQ